MQNIEALKELLRMAHEQLDSQKVINDGLKVRVNALEQALKVAGISIDAPKEQGK
jgi:mevalonate kinase